MNTIHYVLSDTFDYSRMICDDAGPGYARRMGWHVAPLRELPALAGRPHVIDNRLPASEFETVRRHVLAHPRSPVYLKIVDPQLETVLFDYNRFVLSLLRHPNLALTGPYRKTLFTQLAEDIAGRPVYHAVPYAYERHRERPAGGSRLEKLFLSGALSPSTYPDRWRVYRKTRRHLLAWRYISRLRHPGYPDVGQIAHHQLTGERFLDLCARHRLMWVDSSAYDMELLKFTECAYAACVPVGTSASTLPSAVVAEIAPLSPGSEVPALRALLSSPSFELEARALRYRETLRAARDPHALREAFLGDWRRVRATLDPVGPA